VILFEQDLSATKLQVREWRVCPPMDDAKPDSDDIEVKR